MVDLECSVSLFNIILTFGDQTWESKHLLSTYTFSFDIISFFVDIGDAIIYQYIAYHIILYTTLAWAFKGAAQCLTRILPGQYQDIARAISWESGLPMTLIPSQFKESMRFDSLY